MFRICSSFVYFLFIVCLISQNVENVSAMDNFDDDFFRQGPGQDPPFFVREINT